jgi:hypothetical protein
MYRIARFVEAVYYKHVKVLTVKNGNIWDVVCLSNLPPWYKLITNAKVCDNHLILYYSRNVSTLEIGPHQHDRCNPNVFCNLDGDEFRDIQDDNDVYGICENDKFYKTERMAYLTTKDSGNVYYDKYFNMIEPSPFSLKFKERTLIIGDGDITYYSNFAAISNHFIVPYCTYIGQGKYKFQNGEEYIFCSSLNGGSRFVNGDSQIKINNKNMHRVSRYWDYFFIADNYYKNLGDAGFVLTDPPGAKVSKDITSIIEKLSDYSPVYKQSARTLIITVNGKNSIVDFKNLPFWFNEAEISVNENKIQLLSAAKNATLDLVENEDYTNSDQVMISSGGYMEYRGVWCQQHYIDIMGMKYHEDHKYNSDHGMMTSRYYYDENFDRIKSVKTLLSCPTYGMVLKIKQVNHVSNFTIIDGKYLIPLENCTKNTSESGNDNTPYNIVSKTGKKYVMYVRGKIAYLQGKNQQFDVINLSDIYVIAPDGIHERNKIEVIKNCPVYYYAKQYFTKKVDEFIPLKWKQKYN